MDYYGVLREIIELDFYKFRVVLFKCDWVGSGKKDIKVEDGLTLVNLHPRVHSYARDPFILVEQANQVFYVRENSTSPWYVVLRAPPRGFHNLKFFDEIAYRTDAPLDVSILESRLYDDEEDFARNDCEDLLSKMMNFSAIYIEVHYLLYID